MARNWEDQPHSLFGVPLPDNTGAHGSTGASGPAADDNPAIITDDRGDNWARISTSTHGSVQPGQVAASPISPGPAGDYADSGAGQGHTDAWSRRPWQQAAGDAQR